VDGARAGSVLAEYAADAREAGVRFEKLSRAELEKRYPQIDFGSVTWGMLEPDSGALIARRAVQSVVEATIRIGTDYRVEAVEPPAGSRIDFLARAAGSASTRRASSSHAAHGCRSCSPTC
jgi:glycine/D-amino acid oxidase-like deaminating enzyme